MREYINIVSEAYTPVSLEDAIAKIVSEIDEGDHLVEWWSTVAPKVFAALQVEPTHYHSARVWLDDPDNATAFKHEFDRILREESAAVRDLVGKPIYRIMTVDGHFLEHLQSNATIPVGIFWTHSPLVLDTFMQYSGPEEQKQYEIVFEAIVHGRDVNWETTLNLALELGDFEGEVRMIPDRPAEITAIKVDGKALKGWNASLVF